MLGTDWGAGDVSAEGGCSVLGGCSACEAGKLVSAVTGCVVPVAAGAFGAMITFPLCPDGLSSIILSTLGLFAMLAAPKSILCGRRKTFSGSTFCGTSVESGLGVAGAVVVGTLATLAGTDVAASWGVGIVFGGALVVIAGMATSSGVLVIVVDSASFWG